MVLPVLVEREGFFCCCGFWGDIEWEGGSTESRGVKGTRREREREEREK